ncbi:MAG: ABC transporter substrate-binding protein [Thermoleophilia bacterium]|nr:ABC transporter substrate-binding protein [Thermoleophilia bacterium]
MKKTALSSWLVLMLVLVLVSVMAVACGEEETTTTAGPSTTAGPTTSAPASSETTAPASSETTAPAGEVKELVIGADAFLTGPAAAGGMAAKRGWELAAAHVNNAGGLKIGNDTYKIKLVVEDDAMSVDQAATVVQKMIQQDGAKYIMGPLVDAFKNVIYPICAEAGVMLADVDTKNASRAIQYDGNTDVSPDKPLHARFHWANDEMIPHLLDYLAENYPQAKKIAVCGVTEACTVALFDWLGTYLPTRGLERVGQLEQMAPDTADYNPPVQRLLSAKPDAILVAVSTPTTWGFVTKAAREQGFKGPVMCATHLDVEFAARIAGGGVTDMFGAGVCLSDLEALPQAMKDAHAEYQAAGYPAQDEIADVYLVGYNGLWVLLQAIEKAQSVDPQVVFEKYQQMTEPGTFKTLWGDGAYVGGLKSTGINAVLNEPYWINAIGPDGKAKNVKQIFVTVP